MTATRRSWWEAAGVALALAVLAAVLYGPNAINGGFLSDAWANRSIYVFAPQEGFFGAVDRFMDEPNVAARPLYAVYLAALNGVFGSHMGYWLVWLGATGVLMSVMLYLLLRKLDFELLDAAVIAGLVLAFPAASSLRLWAAVVQIPVAVSLATFGFLLALHAFDREGGRRAALHFLSLTCFVASLLFYEAALGVMLASILLYRLAVPWATAAARWTLDVIVLITATVLVGGASDGAKEVQGVEGMWGHATEIFDQSLTLLATVVLPFASSAWYVLALIALLPAIGLLTLKAASTTDAARAQLRHWLIVLAAGALVVFLGYAVFVPGIDYYAPMAPGIANRVNAVPSIGWVLVLYSLAMIGATLILPRQGSSSRLAPVLATTACVLIGVSWVQRIDSDSDDYTQAFREGDRALIAVRAAVPDPSPGSAIWTFGQPVEIAPGIPVFGNTWDMTAAVQLMYEDGALSSYVGFPGTTFACTRYQVVPGGHTSYPQSPDPYLPSEFAASYNGVYFVDTVTGRSVKLRTPAQCRRAARSFKRSPSFPSG